MEKLVGRRNAQLVQVKWQLAAAEKLHERNASHGEVLDRLEQLQDLARKFRDTQSEIEENQPDPEAIASVHNFREEFNTHFYRAKDALERYISHNDNDDDGDNSSIRGSSGSYRSVAGSSRDLREAMQMLLEAQRTMMLQSSGGGANINNVDPAGGEQMPNHAPFANVRLPAINVPTFDGDRKNWRSFKDIFVQTIHARRDLRDSLKMQYLVSYLSGDAKRLVNSFPISDANYKEAWAALSNFYDKKKYTVFSLVREFVEQPVITNATADNLRKLVTTSDEVVRQLNALGEEYNTRDPWLIHLLLEKLDKDTRSLWAQRIIDVENPSYEEFLKFLDNRCDALETCTAFSRKVTTDGQRKDPGKKMQAEKKMQSLHATTVIQKCAKCSSEHPIHMCEDFKKMDLQCKRELVQKAKLCYNCLRPSHSVKNCASKSVCRVDGCKQRHHTLLCPKIENSSDRKEERSDDPKQPTQPSRDSVDVVSSLVVQVPKPLNETFVLPTALINVKAVDGGFLKCRALIDSGSGASLITEACVNKLGIPRTNGKVVVSGLAQQSAGTTRGIVKLVIANRCNEAVILRTSAFVMGKLTSTLPAQLVKPNSKLLQKEIQDALADPAYNLPAPVDIILGADVFLAILQPGQVKDEFENPVAQNTIFGWIVCGNQSIYTAGVPSNVSVINLHTEVDVNRTLRQFWEQEEVPKSQLLATEEQAAVECFRSTTTRDDSGRFIVRLPFDESKPALGESLTPAIKRLRAMEKRFERDPVFHRQYCDFVEEYLALGHMEEVPANDLSMEADKCFYLPHHAVMKADSSTTKLRVVFDASSSSGSGISLNDRLLAGPNINQDLFDVHLRFRSNEIAFAADAEKMFRQVWVHPHDRDFQRVVWRSDPGEPIKHFRLCTVTYGTKPAPYLAIESMREAARNYETVYPEAAQRIVLDMYVDDFMSGAKNIDEARQMKVQVCEILSSAGFNLRKWTTNRPELLSDNEYTEQVPVEMKLAEQPEAVKALGIQWLPKDNVFSFKVSLSVDSINTKRQLLSDSSRLFDPYGWLSPVMVKIKILFQQLWLSDVSWDDPLPASVEVPWKDIKEGLHLLEQIRIPRYMVSFGGKVQLHGFSDASEMAYGAVIYSRARDDAGNIFVNLVAAKTRVAPIKQVSLPRLELSAAALLAELMQRVTQALSHLTVEHWAWTDNTIVLQWLSSHPRRWKTYVANRTSAILDFLPRERWNHVSSQDNPADCASRGLSPGEFVSFDLWFLGPEWLRQDEEFWNAEPYEPIVDEDSLEERKLKALHSLPISCRSNYAVELELLHRRSSYRLVVRALAYVNRFLQAARGVQHEPTLTPIEIDSARLQLARAAQFDVFKHEMEILAKTGELPIKNRLSALHPFLDDSGTMRVGGRLQNSPYSFNVKHPVILPRDHRLTESLLRELHLQNLHAGPTLLTATVNQQYWVVGLQTAIRRTVRSCIRCVRLKGQTANQLMGSLPVCRVMATRAFTHVGVDYAGPFKIHALCVRGVKTSKGYLAVFVCMATKAVHLEAASDLSSSAFIAALKRFIGRRGYPNEIWSDNGTNFVGTDNWLQDLQRSFRNNSRAVDHFLTNQGIKWIFNPPSAPHRGGIWEAAVKSAKKHILAVVGSEPLTFEEFTTVLSQVEACLNSRPVCALSSNTDSYEALTPGHFLVGQPLNLIPEPGVRHIPVNRLDRWQALQKHTEEIWRRWREEYVATLQPRTKWRTTEDNVKENQLVLVKNENVPPTQWELARIVKLHPDPSGIVRTVTLRRGQTEYQRPVQKVCVLLSD